MLKQLKYSARIGLSQRLVALGATVLLNLVFYICGRFGAYGVGGFITAVSLSGVSLFAVLVVSIIADFESIKSLFAAPAGYTAFLTPVPRWKILLGRLLPMVVFDIVALLVGTVGVVAQSVLLSGLDWSRHVYVQDWGDVVFMCALLLVGYVLLLLLLFFVAAMCKSVYYRLPAKTLLGVVSAIVILYLFNLMDFALMPFGSSNHWGMFYTVDVAIGLNAGTIVFFLLLLVKTAALFCGTTYLMERKINI